jgi:hypothetical protein
MFGIGAAHKELLYLCVGLLGELPDQSCQRTGSNDVYHSSTAAAAASLWCPSIDQHQPRLC